jgi:hypothetical protein
MHWQLCVSLFFEFYQQNFSGEKPSFDGSAPRNLKNIVLALKKRAEDKSIEWTKEVAQERLLKFLEYAYNHDDWTRKNFMPHILDRKKDAIFASIASGVKPKVVDASKGVNSGHVSGEGWY